MPILISAFRLPCGAEGVRADCTGEVNAQDAQAWFQQTDPGGAFHLFPIHAVALKLERVTTEARSAFSRRGDDMKTQAWMAVVVTNPVLRVTPNFSMRISGTRKMRLFGTEEAAVAWLDDRHRQDEAARAAPAAK